MYKWTEILPNAIDKKNKHQKGRSKKFFIHRCTQKKPREIYFLKFLHLENKYDNVVQYKTIPIY